MKSCVQEQGCSISFVGVNLAESLERRALCVGDCGDGGAKRDVVLEGSMEEA